MVLFRGQVWATHVQVQGRQDGGICFTEPRFLSALLGGPSINTFRFTFLWLFVCPSDSSLLWSSESPISKAHVTIKQESQSERGKHGIEKDGSDESVHIAAPEMQT